MKHKKAISFAAVIVAISVLCAAYVVSTEKTDPSIERSAAYSYGLTQEYLLSENTDNHIVIISDDSNIDHYVEIFSFGTLFVAYKDDLSLIDSEDTVIIDSEWYESRAAEYVDDLISNLIENGKTVISIGSLNIFKDNPNMDAYAFSDNADIYGVSYNADMRSYSFLSIDCEDEELALQKTYCWIDRSNNESIVSEISSIEMPYYDVAYEVHSFNYHRGYGWLNVMADYYKLSEQNTKNDYYLTHYVLQAIPIDGTSTADMRISSEPSNEEMNLVGYCPTTSYGSDMMGIQISSIQWKYYVEGVMIYDHSNYAFDKFDISHDVDENGLLGNRAYAVEPGKVVKVDIANGIDGYIGTDNYIIQFLNDGNYESFGVSTYLNFHD
jgi:hypothetical protein